VLPQEIIFRLFFFERYRGIFKTRELMIIASGLAFGLAHIIFENWVAALLCAVGGILFAMTYTRHRSLALVSLEHALYGDFVFTVGLGYYFYHGSVAAISGAVH
jgi:membrane protease YdiL (CAAX protease family)